MRKNIPDGLRYRVLKRDGFRCRYCGAHGSEAELQIDHVQPVSAGGKNQASNLVTACRSCNGGKGASLPEWVDCCPPSIDYACDPVYSVFTWWRCAGFDIQQAHHANPCEGIA